jgi:hypothetical protein
MRRRLSSPPLLAYGLVTVDVASYGYRESPLWRTPQRDAARLSRFGLILTNVRILIKRDTIEVAFIRRWPSRRRDYACGFLENGAVLSLPSKRPTRRTRVPCAETAGLVASPARP